MCARTHTLFQRAIDYSHNDKSNDDIHQATLLFFPSMLRCHIHIGYSYTVQCRPGGREQ